MIGRKQKPRGEINVPLVLLGLGLFVGFTILIVVLRPSTGCSPETIRFGVKNPSCAGWIESTSN